MSSPSSSLGELIYIWELSRFLMQMSYCGEAVVSRSGNIIKFARNVRPPGDITKLTDSCVAKPAGNNGFDIQLNIQGSPKYSFDPNQWGKRGVGDPEIFILSHWLTYIYDIRMPAEVTWGNLYPIMFLLSHEYITNCKKVNIDNLLSKYCPGCNAGDRKWVYKSCNCIDLEYGRGGFDRMQRLYEKVKRTLEILQQYDCSIVKYMAESLEYVKNNCSNISIEDNWIRIIAYALNILTYENTKRLNCNNSKFRQYLKQSNGTYTYIGGKKRLWSALKDYIMTPAYVEIILYKLRKYNMTSYELYKRFNNIHDTMCKNCFDLWIQDFVEQLELPGDRWNNRIKDVIARYIGIQNTKNISARDVYNMHISILKERKLYPIHLEASYFSGDPLIDLAEKILSGKATALDEFTRTIIENCPRVRGGCCNDNVEFFCPLITKFLRSEGYGNYILCPFDNVFQCPLFKGSKAELLGKQREHELWHIKCK